MDALAGSRSREEIKALLEKGPVKRFTNHGVNQKVYLIKRALGKAEYNQNLIQTDRQKGVRLAYKRGGQGLPHPWPDAPSIH
jgi:DNA-binding winged helix-turn-helix (wHTH) protein